MGFTTLSLKGRALRMLSQREHSRAELQRKLGPHVQEGDDLTALLDDLQARDFISEARVVESVLNQRASRLGGNRIRQELQAKGIDPDAVQQAVSQLKDTEWARAHAVWLRKFGGTVAEDSQQRARQVRFLVTRGFSSEIAWRVVRGEAPEAEEES